MDQQQSAQSGSTPALTLEEWLRSVLGGVLPASPPYSEFRSEKDSARKFCERHLGRLERLSGADVPIGQLGAFIGNEIMLYKGEFRDMNKLKQRLVERANEEDLQEFQEMLEQIARKIFIIATCVWTYKRWKTEKKEWFASQMKKDATSEDDAQRSDREYDQAEADCWSLLRDLNVFKRMQVRFKRSAALPPAVMLSRDPAGEARINIGCPPDTPEHAWIAGVVKNVADSKTAVRAWIESMLRGEFSSPPIEMGIRRLEKVEKLAAANKEEEKLAGAGCSLDHFRYKLLQQIRQSNNMRAFFPEEHGIIEEFLYYRAAAKAEGDCEEEEKRKGHLEQMADQCYGRLVSTCVSACLLARWKNCDWYETLKSEVGCTVEEIIGDEGTGKRTAYAYLQQRIRLEALEKIEELRG
jgi:hypothetical protein